MENDPRIEKILLSTGNVNRNYIVRDIVFAAEKMTVDIFDSTIDPNQLLSKINYQLKEKAVEYGADAVINCHFNHERTFIGQDPIVEIFAYGTVIQFTQSTMGG
ncbi:MAG TPA: heavy metal-binding domain-containing protein [Tetragenococcus sp.]|nr:heavy metal-binding domain-containing protein [Tetragenococcus sp.]